MITEQLGGCARGDGLGDRARGRALGRWLVALGAVAIILLGLAGRAQADLTATADIHSAGPLTDVVIGNDLSCQVGHIGDSSYEFFAPGSAPGSCGTFLFESASGTLFGPSVGLGPSATAWATATQAPVTGDGTAASPLTVSTVVTDGASPLLQVTETDSYVAGQNFYTTRITIQNLGRTAFAGGVLYHGGDCFLRGFDSGYGALLNGNAPACTINPNNTPASALEAFVPLSPAGSSWVEGGYHTVWGDIGNPSSPDLPNTVDATTREDNGAAIAWETGSIPPAATETFAFQTMIDDPAIAATGGHVFSGTATSSIPATISGVLATISDSDLGTSPTDYSASIDWGDGSGPDQNAVIGGANGSFTVADSHAYSAPGQFTIRVSISYVGNSANTASATDVANIAAPPPTVAVPTPPTVTSSSGAALTGQVNPNGLATTAHFEYGLDPKYSGGGPLVYGSATAAQSLGPDDVAHTVSAKLTGLVPNALYHVRLVASNSAGTTAGPDQTFTTKKDPAPPPPVLGQSFNAGPVKGLVLIELPAGAHQGDAHASAFVKGKQYLPLTEVRRLPIGTKIDARRGTLNLTTASFKIGKTQSATFNGGLFKLASQTKKGISKGLANIALIENDFPGSPSFNICKLAHKAAAGPPTATTAKTKLSSKILQTLHASENHGRFRTTGRHSAATVRGTNWDTTERCDGTLTVVHRGTVQVNDFGLRKTITLHAGHRYLARADAKPPKKKK